MLHFLKNQDTCRAVLLQAYFGESETVPCGRCDVCVRKTPVPAGLEAQVLDRIRTAKPTPEELIAHFPASLREAVIEKVRNLLDDGLVRQGGDGHISVRG